MSAMAKGSEEHRPRWLGYGAWLARLAIELAIEELRIRGIWPRRW